MPSAPSPAPAVPAPFSADRFADRHHGTAQDLEPLLAAVGQPSLDAVADAAVPAGIRLARPLQLPPPLPEHEALAELKSILSLNQVHRSFIGQGYYDTLTPPVIQRTILENPGWYTAYTPYQAEISQGRLEALLNFQTVVIELTGMEIANASMLDEATAAAEAMALIHRTVNDPQRRRLYVSDRCHPQTLAVVETRAAPLGIEVVRGDPAAATFDASCLGALVQYPDTWGRIDTFDSLAERLHAAGGLLIVATDLLALTLLRPPGAFGADVAVGSAQRFGVPIGFGGPHAGFLATRDAYKRQMPGRLVGVSRDAHGNPALRMALGTREQHIRRDKATSNICTAQVLLAVMASMYAVYHGPDGLRRIARRVKHHAEWLAAALRAAGADVDPGPFFDTLVIRRVAAGRVHASARARRINLRPVDDSAVALSLDEATTPAEVRQLLDLFRESAVLPDPDSLAADFPAPHARSGSFLEHPVFARYHTEHEMLRYIKRLEARDLSLCHSMIPLGSCTMKLNAASEMFPVSWPEAGRIHPFAPEEQWRGYIRLFDDLRVWLAEVTGLPAVSLQPNAGSQGEYAGLLAIRGYHRARGDLRRTVCLIPTSAHGTNPASAVMCGMSVVPVACDAQGNIDLPDLRAKVDRHADTLAALMVTYPSTHGVFETTIREICDLVHARGGQVYMDGANMNAQVGLTSPGRIGADVCHLNLHKTFCIPHGGGGPGMGPIAVAAHLAPHLPGSPLVADSGAVSAAPYGSPSILVIPWMYIRMMGAVGLTEATQRAILNANYIARRLDPYFPVLYRGPGGWVAHECIIDLRAWKKDGIEVEDVAKRLMDFGFHAPTMSWPVAGTLMIEPTESESKEELDRFCDALITIHGEIQQVAVGQLDRVNNPLKHAPHTAACVLSDAWNRPYGRERAAYPAPWVRAAKFWPSVGRVDNVYGDRHLVCSCAGMDAYAETPATA